MAADQETEKFKAELRKKLSKSKEAIDGIIDTVVDICVEIFRFLAQGQWRARDPIGVAFYRHVACSQGEENPWSSCGSKAALIWAQNQVDKDWEIWTSQISK